MIDRFIFPEAFLRDLFERGLIMVGGVPHKDHADDVDEVVTRREL